MFVRNRAGIVWSLSEKEARDRITKGEFVALTEAQVEKHIGVKAPKAATISTDDQEDSSVIRRKYEEVVGAPVPPNMKNNIEWMKKKIDSK